MKAGNRIEFEDNVVIVIDKITKAEVYSGLEDYEMMKNEPWKWVETTKTGKGHYEYANYCKYRVD